MSLVKCPLCESLDLVNIEEIEASKLISIYQKSLGLNIASELRGINQIKLVSCLSCDLSFFEPMTTGSEKFYEELQEFDWYYMDDKNEYTYSSKFIKQTDRVLEVGSGKGAFRKHIDALEYIGLEFNRKAIEEGAKEGIQILQQSIQSFATSHQYQYDVVCAFQVLEHIAEISSFIKACCSCLKPGGFLIYSVPSANSFAKYVPNFVLDMPPPHVTKWSDQALKSLARCMQLELIEIWHEPLQPIHKSFYAETIFINAAFKLLKLKRKNIDHRVLTKSIFLFARQLGKIFAHGLTDHEILPKGISVTTVYQKPLIGF